jgi:hypothetical protein
MCLISFKAIFNIVLVCINSRLSLVFLPANGHIKEDVSKLETSSFYLDTYLRNFRILDSKSIHFVF